MKNSAELLSASGLSVGDEGKVVLEEVELSVETGQVVTLLGANAGGKTTLLRTLVGVLPKIAGQIRLGGKPIENLSLIQRARIAAYVPQELQSPAGYTVAESVAQGRFAFGSEPFARVQEAVKGALMRTDAVHLMDREMAELSGGEKRRVAIARALAQEAKLLLLDEPNAHLDFRHQAELAGLISRLAKDGLAAVIAVHDLDWAARLNPQPFVLVGRKGQMYENLAGAEEIGALREAYGSNVVTVTDDKGHARWLAER